MELLDRYLNAVRSCLPGAQRDDIISELGDDIRSQIEDKEAELCRQLTDPEVEAILNQHGHPLIVASRYRQDQRSLAFGRQIIGPVLFPFYTKVLSFNLGLTSLVLIAIFAALFASGKSVTVIDTFPVFLYQFLIQFTIVTAIFAAADHHWAQHPERWEAGKLRHIWHPAFALRTRVEPRPGTESDAPRVSRFDSISQFVAFAIGLCWLRVAQQAPFMIFGPAAAFVRPAPVWRQFYLPVVLLMLGGMLQAAINLFRPEWVRLRLVYRAANDATWLVISSFLLRAGQWVVLASTADASSEGFRRTVEILNKVLVYGSAGLAIAAAVGLVLNLHRLLRPSPPQTPHTPAGAR